MSRRLLFIAVASVSMMTSLPRLADAQSPQPTHATVSTKWVLLDAIGYGGLGTAVGVMVAAGTASSCGFGPCDGAVMAVFGGAIAGAVGGAAIGIHARRTLARGDQLTPGHRTAVIAGELLAGSTLGAIASIPLINGDGSGTPLGSNERTLGLLTLGGTAIGGIMAMRSANELSGPHVTISPIVGARRYGLDARLAF